MKKTSVVIFCIVVIAGGVFAYATYKTNQENQAINNLHQAAENAAANGDKIQQQIQTEVAIQNSVQSSANTSPGIKTQTVTDVNNSFTMDIPSSWTLGANFPDGFRYDSSSSTNFPPGISVIWYSNNDETVCESDMETSVLLDAQHMTHYSKTGVTIPGAIKATMDTGTDSSERNNITLYVCANKYSYTVSGINLGSPQSPNAAAVTTVQAALKTFKVI